MDRRKFIRRTCAMCALGIAGPILLLESCQKIDMSPQGPTVNFTVDLSKSSYSALKTSGGSIALNGVVIVNTAGSFIAVAQSCTHNGCSVSYNKAGNDFVCPCHGGIYDTSGNVTSGPPPAPLKSYAVTRSGNVLTIAG